MAAERPNILFLFADDHCRDMLGMLGRVDVETPNLDRLAQRGIVFTRAYNVGSWSPAVCISSRNMLVTGRNLWDAESVYRSMDKERAAGVLWPQLMQKAGYRTYFTGKWHVPTDATKCFDVARNVRSGMPKTTPQAYNRSRADATDPWSPYDRSLGGYWEGGKHWSEVAGDDAVEFLDLAAKRPEPFFMYVAFNAPHDPRQSPQEFVERYPLSRVQSPKNFLAEYPYKDAIGCSHQLRDENLAPMPRTEHAVKVHRREYFALITHMDLQIGRILAALAKSGKSDDTWIFFTADHGLAVGAHGLFGKQNMYEHSTGVPFLVAGPGVASGQVETPIYLQDVMATSLDLAGAERPEHVFFRSLMPLIRGEQRQSAYPAIYGAYLDLQRSIAHNGWKLIVYPKAPAVRLYNLAADPLEINDLATDSVHRARRNELFDRLVGLQKEMGDHLQLSASALTN